MSENERDDDRLLALLGEALQPEVAEPPPERVEALRQQLAQDAASPVPLAVRRQRRRRTGLLAAGLGIAAGLIVGLLIGAAAWRDADPTPVPMEQVALSGVPAGIEADAELIAHTWGTEIVLTVEGLEDGSSYNVVFQRTDGSEVDAGTFLGVASRPVVCRLNAATLREDVAGFQVVEATTGEELLSSDLA